MRVDRGFTLVEVLAALAVIAIAMTAIMSNYGHGINTTIALRDRTLALWVAKNRLAGHQANNAWPNPETTEGVADMAGQQWRWREVVSTTPDQDVRRIEIEIRSKPDGETLSRLVGFLAKQ